MQRERQRGADDDGHDGDEDVAALAAPGRVDVRAAAERGTQGGGGALPFLAQIQRAFGRHDIGSIRAHVGGEAERAATAVGAHAFALGDHVVFGRAPDLHTAAHEAAHVVQQRAGRAPAGGLSERDDSLERHADQVADAVVRGESAERLLDQVAPSRGAGPAAPQGVQRVQGLKEGTKVVVSDRLGTITKVKSKMLYAVDFGTGKPEDCLEKSVAPATEQDIERDRLLKERGSKKPTEPKHEAKPSSEAPVFKIGEQVTISGAPLDIYHVHANAKGGFMILKAGEKTPVFFRTFNIHPLSETNRKALEEREKARPRTVGDTVKCPLVGGEATIYKVVEDKGDKLVLEHGSDRVEVERWMVVLGTWTPYVPEKKKVGSHELITDELQESQPGKSKQELGTPSFEKGKCKAYDGKLVGAVAYSKVDFKDTARIDITSSFNDDALTIEYTVLSNPEYMCVRQYPKGKEPKAPDVRDLVPLQLETKPDDVADVMCVVEPPAEQNCATGTVRYTWKALAQAMKIPGAEAMNNLDAKSAVTSAVSELGVKAQWLASVAGKNNQNHTSGGLRQKGGSGKVPLGAISNSDYQKTEKDKRITDWNSGEKLKSTRPVFQKFAGIMAEGKELATTLEAESEFVVRPERFLTIVEKMKTLATTKEYWSHFGILKMTKSDPKQYTDTYYDIAGSKGNDNELLKRGIVLRERSVKTDPEDTFLFAVKGASKQKEGTSESIRMAAQVNLSKKKVTGEGGGGELDKLVQDTSVDNAFGRTLDHALSGGRDVDSGGDHMKKLMGDSGHIKPALQIQSTRYKFLMELDGGTAIDFSADRAEGKQIVDGKVVEPEGGVPPVVHSFEFGVGHPNLTASATPSTSSGPQTVERPYHVPRDLENPDLFEKTDYKQFEKLRDGVMKEALVDKGEKLEKGGNKAQLLAKALGMIPKT